MLQARFSKAKRRGATVVELAAVVAIFCMIMFGILEYCRILYTYDVMQNAAREGARFCVVNYNDPNQITDTQTYVQTMMMGLDKTNTNYSCTVFLADANGNNINSGSTNATTALFEQNICVQVSLTYTPITPGLLHLANSFTLQTKCSMGSEAN